MKTKICILLPSILFALAACEDCRVPQTDNYLTGWTISNQEEPGRARERGGVVFIVSDGNPASTATKEFSCGNGKNCNVSFSVAAPWAQSDNESVSVIFESSSLPQPRVITFRVQPVAGEHPVNLTFPFCGTLKVTVRGNEGNTPKIQTQFSIGPIYYKCMDCAVEEQGQAGT